MNKNLSVIGQWPGGRAGEEKDLNGKIKACHSLSSLFLDDLKNILGSINPIRSIWAEEEIPTMFFMKKLTDEFIVIAHNNSKSKQQTNKHKQWYDKKKCSVHTWDCPKKSRFSLIASKRRFCGWNTACDGSSIGSTFCPDWNMKNTCSQTEYQQTGRQDREAGRQGEGREEGRQDRQAGRRKGRAGRQGGRQTGRQTGRTCRTDRHARQEGRLGEQTGMQDRQVGRQAGQVGRQDSQAGRETGQAGKEAE